MPFCFQPSLSFGTRECLTLTSLNPSTNHTHCRCAIWKSSWNCSCLPIDLPTLHDFFLVSPVTISPAGIGSGSLYPLALLAFFWPEALAGAMATEGVPLVFWPFFSFGNQFDIFRGAQTLGSFLLHRAALEKKTVGTPQSKHCPITVATGFPAHPKVSAQTPHFNSKLTFYHPNTCKKENVAQI